MTRSGAIITPQRASKRARRSVDAGTQTTTIIYRSNSERKKVETSITHAASTRTSHDCNAIVQGNDSNERTGSKVKILRIEGMVRSTGDQSMRLTLYAPKIPAGDTSLLGTDLNGPVNLDNVWVLKDWWLHAGTSPCNRGSFWSYKLPMGAIAEYGASTAGTNDFRKNRFVLRIQTAASDTVEGYIRTWFVDP